MNMEKIYSADGEALGGLNCQNNLLWILGRSLQLLFGEETGVGREGRNGKKKKKRKKREKRERGINVTLHDSR